MSRSPDKVSDNKASFDAFRHFKSRSRRFTRSAFRPSLRVSEGNMSQDQKATEMGTKGVGRLLLEYSIPAILGMVIVALNQIISSIYIGHGVGHLALAAMAVTFPLVNLLMAFCLLVAVGCAALCSIELGRKDMEKARSMLGHSVLLEIIFGLFFGVVFWIFLDPLLMFFGASGETLRYAHEFMMPLVLLSPLSFLMLGFNFLARATGYPKTAMMTALLSSVGIVAFSPIFIYWWGWGMYGAAWAQIAGQTMSVIWLVAHFARKSSLIHFQKDIWKLSWTAFRRILAIGMAPFLINFCACIVVVIINRALKEYGGDLAIGAFGILNRLLMLFAMSVIGLGQGMQPIIGFNFGAKKPERVRLALKYGMLSATAITLVGMLGSWFFPNFWCASLPITAPSWKFRPRLCASPAACSSSWARRSSSAPIFSPSVRPKSPAWCRCAVR